MQNNQLVPSKEELSSYTLVAQSASETSYWKQLGGMPALLSVMLIGRELGIAPMNSISGMFHVIQDKIEISGRGMSYLIRKQGHTIQLVNLNDGKCVLHGIRADTGESQECSYTIEEAKRCGLVRQGGMWTKLPQDMLYWRALSRLARRLFTDCLGSCYVEGEISDSVKLKKGEEPVRVLDRVDAIDISMIKSERLDLPEGISESQFEEYVKEISSIYDVSPEVIKQKANKNPEEFFKKLYEYLESQLPHQEQQLA